MQGLEKVYYDLDNIRKRLVRLVEMDRIPEPTGISLMSPILKLLEIVNGYIERGIEDGGGNDVPVRDSPVNPGT